MTFLRVPVIPNSPLMSAADHQVSGIIKLHSNRALGFVENAEFDPRIAKYDDAYQNSQAHSPQFLRHMTNVLEILKSEFPKGSRIVEVGCGKGSFIELVEADQYFSITGFDATYEGNNPSVIKRYLSANDHLRTDIIVLRHVLEHIKAPHTFLDMLKSVFQTGKIYIEVPNYDWIVANRTFFDITYEHVNYFSQQALSALFSDSVKKSGLLFGDQYQFVIANISLLSEEFSAQYTDGIWDDVNFDALFPNISEEIQKIENQLVDDAKLYIWGAATKGCMFLVHCANQNRLIERIGFAVDLNPQKCGKFLPGSLVPIKSKKEFFRLARNGDVLVISNPNYKEEILAELNEHTLSKLKVIVL